MSVPQASRQPGPATPGPIRLGPTNHAALRPAESAQISAGFWQRTRQVNARVSIPQGPALLESSGNLHNLRLAAGTATGDYRGDLPFLDSDVTKWLEAASWQMADPDGGDPSTFPQGLDVAAMIRLLAEAQRDDGYVQSWYQVVKPGRRFMELDWGHELYCAGHLIQAAIAHHRATGGDELLFIARRFADHIDDTFGVDKTIDGVCGHPEIETALVELYRETGERRYLDLAGYFIDRRGHGLLGKDGDRRQPLDYHQDHIPVREAQNVAGHAVRQLYLLAGATDVATETGEVALRSAMERLWESMTATKTFLTGGVGSRHEWEDFGDPYELPPDRTYCETCAAIASIQWSWRLALLTGRARYSDLVERTLFNGFLAGVSLDGLRWLYVNPLQVRDGYTGHAGDQGARRTLWFRCACCPPNVMRLLASLPHYLASTDGDGLQLHQYATGSYGGSEMAVRVLTDYPWNGRIQITVDSPADQEWTLALRIPQWCSRYQVEVDGQPIEQGADQGWLRIHRRWHAGDTVTLTLAMEPRLVSADPRVDAIRGCVAIERGPLVHCLEQVDQGGAPSLDDVVLDTEAELTCEHRPDLLEGVTTVRATGWFRPRPEAEHGWWPYRAVGGREGAAAPPARGAGIELTAIPYYSWANRSDGGMRVWLPTD